MSNFADLPQINYSPLNQTPRKILKEKNYIIDKQQLNSDIASLNNEQRTIFDTVINDINGNKKNIFFVDEKISSSSLSSMWYSKIIFI